VVQFRGLRLEGETFQAAIQEKALAGRVDIACRETAFTGSDNLNGRERIQVFIALAEPGCSRTAAWGRGWGGHPAK
jgi:hypothetical protein